MFTTGIKQLESNEASNDIKTTRGTKHKELISRLFPYFHSRRSQPQRWVTYSQQ